MLRRTSVFALILLAFLNIHILPVVSQTVNSSPLVSNVYAQQRPRTKVVEITYDVDDPDYDMLTISVAVSDDGGNTFLIPARTFLPGSDIWRGDSGLGISPGFDKKIVWDAGADAPNLFDTDFRVKITASDSGMVLIPGGSFLMGDAFSESSLDELPVHEVYLNDFYIDAYEVTNAQYKEFLDASSHPAPDDHYWPGGTYPAGKGNYPVAGVSWFDSAAYAQWAGKRLPTEAEWEKAARGWLAVKRYPWGNGITTDDANYNGLYDTTPVGSYPPNGYGLYDVSGNIYEWCADWYGSYSSSPPVVVNPRGPSSGSFRVLRGGHYLSIDTDVRVTRRFYLEPSTIHPYSSGFRCAGDVIP